MFRPHTQVKKNKTKQNNVGKEKEEHKDECQLWQWGKKTRGSSLVHHKFCQWTSLCWKGTKRGGRNSPVQTVGSIVDPYDKYKKNNKKKKTEWEKSGQILPVLHGSKD